MIETYFVIHKIDFKSGTKKSFKTDI